jgi:DNA-directed RNA polymerase specialized sigma24 family protein
MARPRKPVDLVEVIGRRWAGQSFREIARRTGLGLGTVVRAHRQAMESLAAFQNHKADQPVTDDGSQGGGPPV